MADKQGEMSLKPRTQGMNAVHSMRTSQPGRHMMRSLLVALTGLAVLSTTGYADTFVNIFDKEKSEIRQELQRLREKAASLQERLNQSRGERASLRGREIEALRRARKVERQEQKAAKRLESYTDRLHQKIDILRKAYHGCEVVYNRDLRSGGYKNDASDVFTQEEIDENKYRYPYARGKFHVDNSDVGVSCELLTPWRHHPDGKLKIYGFTFTVKEEKTEQPFYRRVELSARSTQFDNDDDNIRTTLKLEVTDLEVTDNETVPPTGEVSLERTISLEVETIIPLEMIATTSPYKAVPPITSVNEVMDVKINVEGEILDVESRGGDSIGVVGANLLTDWDKNFILEAMMRKLGLIN